MAKMKTNTKRKKKTIPVPKTSITELEQSRDGGQIALRGYSYQFLYSCYLMLSFADESAEFHLEGIEDIDCITCENGDNSITHIQLKYSTVKQDASFMSSVLKNYLEAYLIDKNRNFKLIYDFSCAEGNLSKLFKGNLDESSRKYWRNVIEKIKKEVPSWPWNQYDFDEFISKLSFENIKKDSLEDKVESALIGKFDITTANIKLFANSIKVLCLGKMENRSVVTLSDLQQCIESVKFDISIGPQNPAHSWIKRIEFTVSEVDKFDYYEGKKATPVDIANNLPVSRPMLEKELIDSVCDNMITIIKSSSGQGKTTLALKTQFALQNEYVPYQITCCNDIHEIGHIVEYFYSRTKLGEKPLILLDNLDAHLSEWNKLAQYMQSDVKHNYKLIVTSRENDWYNYGGDISKIHSMKIIKPILLEKEAEGIFYMLQAAGHIHSDISDWRKPWSMIVDKKLLIEYVYLLTHGEMISERISAQMQEIGNSITGGIKFEVLRKVCFADICGIKLPTKKLFRNLSTKTGYDIGELVRSMEDEFLVHVSRDGDYIEGLHPVRSHHIVNRLHEYYPIDETALDVTKIANETDFPVLFSHYPEYEFDKEKFYSDIVDIFWDTANLEKFVFAIRGSFSGSVMQYFRNNEVFFNNANEHGGLYVLATEICPFAKFQEIDESLETLEEMAKILPDNDNIQYLIQLRDNISKIDMTQTDVYFLSFKLYQKLKDIFTVNIADINSYAIIVDWLYNMHSTLDLASNIDLENLWSNSEKYSIDAIALLMYTAFCGNKKIYLKFVESNMQEILTYIKHKTLSHNLYISDEGKGVHVEYILRASDKKRGNDESVSRLKYVCRILPIFETYYADAIMPQLDVLDMYTIPDDAHKHMPRRNLVIMFHQEFTSLWIKTIQSNYEFDSVTEWVEYWFNARKCACEILEKFCIYMYKILGCKKIGNTGVEIANKVFEYSKFLNETKLYPKENRPFQQSPDLPQKFTKIKQKYFGRIQNFTRQLVSFAKKESDGKRLVIINLKEAKSTLSLMHSFFDDMTLDEEIQKKHEFLCKWEYQKLHEAYMCCHYYIQHEADVNFNKYQVRTWYESMQKKEICRVNEELSIQLKMYNAEFPKRIYEDGILSFYPIILKKFNIADGEMMTNFLVSIASISKFPYDYMVLMCCKEKEEILPVALKISNRLFELLSIIISSGEEKELDSLSTPYPINVTQKMLDCFDDEKKVKVQENSNHYTTFIGDIAEELWVYSKNRELLYSDDDRDYCVYMLKKAKEKIDVMLKEVKLHLSSEIYHELTSLCDSVYDGAIFENEQFNSFIEKCQTMIS